MWIKWTQLQPTFFQLNIWFKDVIMHLLYIVIKIIVMKYSFIFVRAFTHTYGVWGCEAFWQILFITKGTSTQYFWSSFCSAIYLNLFFPVILSIFFSLLAVNVMYKTMMFLVSEHRHAVSCHWGKKVFYLQCQIKLSFVAIPEFIRQVMLYLHMPQISHYTELKPSSYANYVHWCESYGG